MAENSPAKDEKEPAKGDAEVTVGGTAPPSTVGRKPLEGRVIRGTKGEVCWCALNEVRLLSHSFTFAV